MSSSFVFVLDGGAGVLAAVRDDGMPFSLRIGRGSECDVALPDTAPEVWTVSRVHARFFRHAETYWVEDLHSKNLTWVDGRVALSPVRVNVPCELRLGSVTIRVEHRPLDRRELERLYAPPSLADSASATQGLEQLGLLDGKTRALLGQVEQELRLGSALRHVVEIMSEARRAEEAEIRLAQALEVHVNAARVHVAADISPARLQTVLEDAGLAEHAASLAKDIPAADQASGVLFRKDIATPPSRVWGLRRRAAGQDAVSLVVAHFAEAEPSEAESAARNHTIELTLRLAVPFIHALREAEERQAAATDLAEHAPSEQMMRACREARFWGTNRQFLLTLYQAERAATAYFRQPSGGISVVLFLGESGVGKSTLARLMHRLSDRATGPFVEANCASIPENLAESELFGHKKGAFTGADAQHQGLFEQASGGMLFLDEVGTMALGVQSKLLSVLDTGEFRRIGDASRRRTDCYLVLATNEDPEALRQEGRLREDLWYRIQTLTISIPPLRDRREDIGEIVRNVIDSLNAELAPPVAKHPSPHLMRLLQRYTWPGNVRELKEGLAAAFRLSAPERPVLEEEDLPPRLHRAVAAVDDVEPHEESAAIDVEAPLADNVHRLEREYLVRVLRASEGVKKRAVARAEISPQTLYNKLEEFRAWLKKDLGAGQQREVARLADLAGPYWDVIAGSKD